MLTVEEWMDVVWKPVPNPGRDGRPRRSSLPRALRTSPAQMRAGCHPGLPVNWSLYFP